MRIACLHTAESHSATFSALFAQAAPAARLETMVRPDLLARARADGPGAVRADLAVVLAKLAADAVLCTCSTLGPLVDALGDPRLVRIDRPMMEAAVASGPVVLLAVCLESAKAPALALLADCADRAGVRVHPEVVFCAGAWARFEAGDMPGFADTVARAVSAGFAGHDCIVLAQASMHGAAPLLADLGVPVLTSPQLAVARTVAMAAR